MTTRFLTCIVVFSLVFLCQCGNKPGNTQGSGSGGTNDLKFKPKNFLLDIDSLEEYRAMMGEPLTAKFSNVYSVKVIYDLKSQRTYFINSHMYTYHYDFALGVLGSKQDLYLFNQRNYHEDPTHRDYLLGNLNFIPQTSDFFLELSPADAMDLHSIHQLYGAIQSHFHITDTLFYYPNTPRLMKAYEDSLIHMPVITTERIFGTIQYQAVFPGKTTGVLKKYTIKELDSIVPAPDEIVILDQTPLVLPRVRGVIVGELQTPLSHLVLLGRNRGIPIAAQKDAWTNQRLNYFIGKKVEITVSKDSFSLALFYDDISVNGNRNTIQLPMDTSVHEIVDLSRIPDYGIEKIGSKAFHYSLLYQLSKSKLFKVPEYGFAIPYYFYWEHFIKSGAAAIVPKLSKTSDPEKEKDLLKKMRKLIKDHPVNKKLLQDVESKIREQSQFNSFRFRSSTNAEDLPEFNGAGLYDSETAVLGDKKETIERALKKVWASTWSERAYYERKYFGINQQTISMGVLVHRSFPDEECNGVVVTQNIYRNTGGITVNVQKGENSVVMPKKGEVTEIFTVYEYNQPPWTGKFIIDYVSFSPLNEYKPILSEKEIQSLYKAVKQIKFELLANPNLYGEVNKQHIPRKNAEFDLEFKLMGKKRELYIKQVRVYK